MPLLLLPLLAPALAAALAALIYFAGHILGKFIAHLMPGGLPVIGNALRNAVEGLVTAALDLLQSFLDGIIRPIEAVISYPVHVITRLFDDAIAAGSALRQVLGYTVSSIIPRFYRAGIAVAKTLIATAVAQLTAKITSLSNWLNNRVAALVARIAYFFHQAIAYVDHEIGVLGAYVAGRVGALISRIDFFYHQAIRYADALVGAAAATLAHSIAAVDHFARHAYADTLGRIAAMGIALEHFATNAAKVAAAESVAVLERGVTDGMTDVWHGIRTEVRDVEGVIAGDFPDIMAGLRSIPVSVPTDIAGAIAGVGALSIPLLRYLKGCGAPNCRNLGGLGHDLQALLGMVEDAAFLAMIIGLISDPSGAAHEIHDVLGPLADATISGARDLFQVA